MQAATLSALAEPTRLKMIELMRGGPMSVGDIADALSLSQPQTSKHLRVLLEAHLVEVTAIANRRIYRLRPEPFTELSDWLATFTERQEQRYAQLDDYLAKSDD